MPLNASNNKMELVRLQVSDLMRGFAEGILVVDSSQGIVANEAMKKILGLEKRRKLDFGMLEKSATGQNILELFRDLEEGNEPEIERDIALIGKGRFLAHLKTLPENDSSHKATMCVLASRNLPGSSEEGKLRDEALSKVSHEFRTRLAAIRGSIENVADGLLGVVAPEQKKFLAIAVESVNRLTVLIEDLLDPLRIKKDEIRVKKRKMDLFVAVRTAMNGVRAFGQKGGVELRKEIPGDLPAVYGDSDKIEQVIFNLLENAIKFTPKGGTVTVEVFCHQKTVEVAVSDTGRGIPKTKLEGLFKQGKRTSEVASTGGRPGSGLGLKIVQDLLSAHGCQIRVRSTVGKGSRFSFELEKYTNGQGG